MAAWMLDAMDVAGCGKAVLCGHSMGGLVALELARRAPERVNAAIFVATASAIPVNDRLMTMAEKDEESAFGAMVAWAYGPHAHNHENSWPGSSQVFTGLDIMRLNRQGALLTDLSTCAGYATGAESARAARFPTLCVFSKLDRMTPVKGGLALADALTDNQTILLANCGHAIPTESPRELNSAMRKFLAAGFNG
jgi:pimeloyl-ACP methyl ester carboxylesterase